MMKLTIVKVGGKIVEESASLAVLLDDFVRIDGHKLLVHGGGRSATALATRMGIETKMIEGRRITDEAMLDIVTMVYAGRVNKHIVAGLQARSVNALGLTGADLGLMRSDKRAVKEIDYGFVGDVREVNTAILRQLIEQGVVPVLAPLTHDGNGSLLNTNADTIAGETAKALANSFSVRLVYCFEKNGVLRDEHDDNSVIPILTPQSIQQLSDEGVITGGMLPKLHNAIEALQAGVSEVIITHAKAIADTNLGTRIINAIQ